MAALGHAKISFHLKKKIHVAERCHYHHATRASLLRLYGGMETVRSKADQYKMQTDTKIISVKNTINFRFLTHEISQNS